jgi:hypothetical protein
MKRPPDSSRPFSVPFQLPLRTARRNTTCSRICPFYGTPGHLSNDDSALHHIPVHLSGLLGALYWFGLDLIIATDQVSEPALSLQRLREHFA